MAKAPTGTMRSLHGDHVHIAATDVITTVLAPATATIDGRRTRTSPAYTLEAVAQLCNNRA
jgi:hypothetical protein